MRYRVCALLTELGFKILKIKPQKLLGILKKFETQKNLQISKRNSKNNCSRSNNNNVLLHYGMPFL